VGSHDSTRNQVPGTDMTDAKHEILKRQVQGQLRPVLREADYAGFDLERAFAIVAQIAASLG
jgi:hypothetical protein